MCVCVPLTRCRTVVEPVSPTVGMITRTSLKWRAALLRTATDRSVDFLEKRVRA